MDIKNFFKKVRYLKTIIVILISAIVGTGGFAGYKTFFAKNTDAKVTTTKVTLGDISVEISGGGTLEPINQYTVTSLVKGEIISAPFEEGQTVSKGDLLYKIDTKDIENSIEKSKLNVEKSKLTYDQTVDSINKLAVKSPISGTITNIYVKNGDNVAANGKVADVVDNSTMLLKIPFISSDANQIYVGQTADVTLNNSFYKISGTVTRISTGEIISGDGIATKTVEINVQNPGSIKENDKATALVGNVACNDSGTFAYNNSETILAEVAGKIDNFNRFVGDSIKRGETIAKLTNDSLETSRLQNNMSVKDSELALESQYDQLGNYNITSPISGTIIKKTSKEGDTLDNSNTKVEMAVIADLSKIIFKINVDELDIGKIQLNQKVEITADAVENKTFTGYVDYISIVGTSTNGTTSYPVTVAVDNPEGLITGMNVNAKIVVNSKQNVLKVPVSAVRRGNMVYVKSDQAKSQSADSSSGNNPSGRKGGAKNGAGQSQQNGTAPVASPAAPSSGTANKAGSNKGSTAFGNMPEGFKPVKVETGINDKDFIEIVSGLNEGDTIYVPTVAATSTTQNGMMGGGFPGGGVPGGGYTGGNNNRSNSSSSSSNRSSGSSTSGGAAK